MNPIGWSVCRLIGTNEVIWLSEEAVWEKSPGKRYWSSRNEKAIIFNKKRQASVMARPYTDSIVMIVSLDQVYFPLKELEDDDNIPISERFKRYKKE